MRIRMGWARARKNSVLKICSWPSFPTYSNITIYLVFDNQSDTLNGSPLD